MRAVAAPVARVRVRDAVPADNAALLALAAACPMQGDVGLCIRREPDFFALNRLEGERWRVGVVDAPDGSIAGCIAVAERVVYLHGSPVATAYIGDLKVHPAQRGGPAADALEEYGREAARAFGGDDVVTLITVLAGNRAMERRLSGPRGLPRFTRIGTIRTHSVPLLWRRAQVDADLRVGRAEARDVNEIGALWRALARARQFAPVLDADALTKWLAAAPALALSDYWLARRRDGRLAGFVGLWDQSSFKQLRVTSFSPRLAAVRAGFNTLAPLLGAARLPRAGQDLRCATAVHVCAPPGEPVVLRALLLSAYADLRARGFSFFNIGLDVRDPLAGALRGLLAQPTDVHAYVCTPRGSYAGPPLDDRPLHYEIALV